MNECQSRLLGYPLPVRALIRTLRAPCVHSLPSVFSFTPGVNNRRI